MVVYTPQGGTEKSALKGCLPELEIHPMALEVGYFFKDKKLKD
jgi:hypothetical protein